MHQQRAGVPSINVSRVYTKKTIQNRLVSLGLGLNLVGIGHVLLFFGYAMDPLYHTVDGRSWCSRYPSIHRVLAPPQVFVWDFWTINSRPLNIWGGDPLMGPWFYTKIRRFFEASELSESHYTWRSRGEKGVTVTRERWGKAKVGGRHVTKLKWLGKNIVCVCIYLCIYYLYLYILNVVHISFTYSIYHENPQQSQLYRLYNALTTIFLGLKTFMFWRFYDSFRECILFQGRCSQIMEQQFIRIYIPNRFDQCFWQKTDEPFLGVHILEILY